MLTTSSTVELVDACRSAALGFMASANGWTKRQFAEWLETSYLPLPIGCPATPRARGYKRTPAWGTTAVRLGNKGKVDSDALRDIIASAHAEVAATLRSVSERGSVMGLGETLVHSQLVVRCIDADGASGWAPAATTRMRLADRVLSLFAADFLMRPWDYEGSLHVCAECDSVRFVDVACCERASGSRRIVGRAAQEEVA